MILTGISPGTTLKENRMQNHFGGAVTASGFAFDSQMNFDGTNVYLNIGVYTFFTKNDSWKKPQINSIIIYCMSNIILILRRIGAEKFIVGILPAQILQKKIIRRCLLPYLIKRIKKIQICSRNMIMKPFIVLILAKQQEWNNKIAAEM